jgi:type I restriction enzyme S subunit
VTSFKGNDPKFVYYLFDQIGMARFASGSGVPTLNRNDVHAFSTYLPASVAEQQKIADCLSSLDELIRAESQKLDALKTHKKGLMQQLFPRQGETIPRLRFPEFRDAGEWESKPVGEVFRVTRGEVLAMPQVKEEPSEDFPYPVYSSQTKNNGLAGYFSEYLYENAITWTTDGANAGEVNFRKGKFFCTNVCGVLINPKGWANPFVAALLNSVTRNYVSYIGNPKLMNGVMSEIVIPFPSLPEQIRIADFLSLLDELISLLGRKIDTLETHKKGLMQQLFPVIHEAQA